MQLSNTQSAETPGLHTADAPHSQMRYKDVTLIQITQAVLTVWLYVRDNSFHGSRHTELSWRKRRQWAMRTIRPSLMLPSPGSRSHWACVRGQRSQTSDSHRAEKSHTCGDVEEEGINNEFFLFSWPVHVFFFFNLKQASFRSAEPIRASVVIDSPLFEGCSGISVLRVGADDWIQITCDIKGVVWISWEMCLFAFLLRVRCECRYHFHFTVS